MQRTKCVIFLGTPHRGSGMAGWGELALNIANAALQSSNKPLLSALAVDSAVLDNMHEDFLRLLHNHPLKVHSFQEARGMSGIRGLNEKVNHPGVIGAGQSHKL
jgi:hypothetical protein